MSIQTLLDFIGKYESNNNPRAVWGGIDKADRPNDITKMTVKGVLAWQDSIDAKYMSEASGEWQFMEDTLRGLYREAGVALSERFDRSTQIRLATQLLRRRGLDDYLAGRMTTEKFALSLSKEWASLPIPFDVNGKKAGQSYYAGDGLNKAHAPLDGFLEAVEDVKDRARPEPRENVAQTKTIKGGGAAGAGIALQQCGQQLTDAAIGFPEELARWMVLGGTLVAIAGIGFVIWSRVQDWKAGDR